MELHYENLQNQSVGYKTMCHMLLALFDLLTKTVSTNDEKANKTIRFERTNMIQHEKMFPLSH